MTIHLCITDTKPPYNPTLPMQSMLRTRLTSFLRFKQNSCLWFLGADLLISVIELRVVHHVHSGMFIYRWLMVTRVERLHNCIRCCNRCTNRILCAARLPFYAFTLASKQYFGLISKMNQSRILPEFNFLSLSRRANKNEVLIPLFSYFVSHINLIIRYSFYDCCSWSIE